MKTFKVKIKKIITFEIDVNAPTRVAADQTATKYINDTFLSHHHDITDTFELSREVEEVLNNNKKTLSDIQPQNRFDG